MGSGDSASIALIFMESKQSLSSRIHPVPMEISHLPLLVPEIPPLSGSSNSRNQCFSLYHKFFYIPVEVTYKVTISTSA